jgi:Sulfatase-modifying factor enzyme 1
VLRGGSWTYGNDNNLRVANRNNNNPDNRNNNIGFRCAAPPGIFLTGQVRCFYGTALSPRAKNSRPVPGWASGSTKDKRIPSGVVGLFGSKLRAGRIFKNNLYFLNKERRSIFVPRKSGHKNTPYPHLLRRCSLYL